MDPPGSSGGGEPDCAGGSEGGDGASCLEAAADLPYPQLAQTVSSASFAPAAHLAEHYSPPGGAHAMLLTRHAAVHACCGKESVVGGEGKHG